MLPSFRRGAFALFTLIFAVTLLFGDRAAVAAATTVEAADVLAGQRWWTPLSALFRHPEGVGLFGLLWTLAIQWVIGSRLEGFWGFARYLLMVLVSGGVGYGSAIGLSAAFPEIATVELSGAGPIDAAACGAFGIVFAGERMRFGSREVAPALLAGVGGGVSIAFPLVVTLAAGTPFAQAWIALVPGVVAGLVATLFVQPWRKRENSGKVGRTNQSDHPHLRVVRTPEDMLN